MRGLDPEALPERFLDRIRDGDDLAIVVSVANDEVIGDVADIGQVENDDIVGFLLASGLHAGDQFGCQL